MRNEQALRPRERFDDVQVFPATAQRAFGLAHFVSKYPVASLFAAGTFGFAVALLIRTSARSPELASTGDTRRRLATTEGDRAWPSGDSPKPHGDKFANAARAAATRTRAPTYPEG